MADWDYPTYLPFDIFRFRVHANNKKRPTDKPVDFGDRRVRR